MEYWTYPIHRRAQGLRWRQSHPAKPLEKKSLSLSNGVPMTRAFDPTIAADSSGNLYAGFIADGANWYTGGSPPMPDSGMYVAASVDGGQSWSAPAQVAYDRRPISNPDANYRYNDRCQITVGPDPQGGENVYLAWIKDRGYNMPQPGSDIYFSYAPAQTLNFSTPIQINDLANNLANMPVPVTAADDDVYVTWLHYNVQTGGQGTIYLRRSADGGQTFPNWSGSETDHLVSTINLPPLRVTQADGTVDALAKGAPVPAASPSDPNELYIAYAADPDGPGPDEADIFFIRSTDGGHNWSTPLRVNDDAVPQDPTAQNDQILPWIGVKPDGTIDVAWYDRRNDPADALWDIYLARSVDGGMSFLSNVMLNDMPFATPMQAPGSPGWMGEYLGLAVDANDAYVAWTSSVTDTNGAIHFDEIPNVEIPEPTSVLLLGLGAAALLRRRR
jgi:hypothetical protein